MSQASLRRAGGSVMVTVPPAYLKQNGLSAGQTVRLEMKGDTLTIRPAAKKRITLAEILRGTPRKAARQRAEGWDEIPAAGRETV